MEVVFVDEQTGKPFVASFEVSEGWHKVNKIYSLHKMSSGSIQVGDKVQLPNLYLEQLALDAIFENNKWRGNDNTKTCQSNC